MYWQGVLGLLVFSFIAWLMSEERAAGGASGRFRLILSGLLIQLVLAFVLLKLPLFQWAFVKLNAVVVILQSATEAGTSFVFGYIGGAPTPYVKIEGASSFILAIQALPLVLVISALSALLFHWRVLPALVRLFAWALERSMGLGGAVSISAAANVFVGMVEAPLLVRPYLRSLTRSELFTVMTVGMSTIAGTVMVLYAQILESVLPNALGHLLTASLISIPAAIMISRLMVPETEPVTPCDNIELDPAANAMEAVTKGALDGVGLLINIIAMLVVFVALVALVNSLLALAPSVGGAPITLQGVLGYILAPVAWLMGIPWHEASSAGALLGTKIILNELLAYLDLAAMPESTLGSNSRLILTYGLCGFANFGSLGIMIGGLVTISPDRRVEIATLGLKCIVAGTLSTCMTGAVAGLILR
ncbi:MAG: nucleoside:proton symporter [Rhodospirillaceae bacterium]|jgi:concentrative nucleoside transporter, CNT family|nr:nucleoside:proton symporter [Rhodospirillaceae bacterium]